jgi:hypothetical protein
MDILEITYKNVLHIWWSFFWRASLFSFVAGGVLGGIFGFIAGSLGVNLELIGQVARILGYLISIPVSIFVFKRVLEKKYRDFSVAFIKR